MEYECEGSGPCDSCNDTKFGCCPDGVSAAQGKDFEGCPDPDTTTEEPMGRHCFCGDNEKTYLYFAFLTKQSENCLIYINIKEGRFLEIE